jgi:hypothetical protein
LGPTGQDVDVGIARQGPCKRCSAGATGIVRGEGRQRGLQRPPQAMQPSEEKRTGGKLLSGGPLNSGCGPESSGHSGSPRAARLIPSSVTNLQIPVLFHRQDYVLQIPGTRAVGGSRGTVVRSSVHSHRRFRRRHSSRHWQGVRPCVQTTK